MTGDRHVPADEAALVREVAAGSQDALAALYDRHVDAVFAAAIRLTSDRQVAEEVVQETFLALWNRAELFDPHAGSLAAWLHTIARNRTVDRLRAAGRRPNLVPLSSAGGSDETDTAALERLVIGGTVLGGADLGLGPEGELAASELRDVIRDALAELAGARTNGARAGLQCGTDAIGDRGAARLAARDGEDADAARPAAATRSPGRRARPGGRTGAGRGPDRRARGSVTGEHGTR